MAKLVWRVKLVTELQAGETTEVEVARIERDEQAGLSDLGLRLAEAKQLTSALQAEIVPAQLTIAGEHRCTCAACRRRLASKAYDIATKIVAGSPEYSVPRLDGSDVASGGFSFTPPPSARRVDMADLVKLKDMSDLPSNFRIGGK
jgi:hypothetical protein